MSNTSFIKSTLFCLTLLYLASCSNDLEVVKSLTIEENSANETGKDVQTIYSVNGKLQMILNSPIVDHYTNLDEPYMEMTKGIHLVFYDSLQQENGYMKSEYAIRYEKKELMEAKKNVEVVNEIGEKLNTEYLIWDQKERKIYSDQFVKITTNDEILLGEGFESDDTFSKWKIKKPKGTLVIKN